MSTHGTHRIKRYRRASRKRMADINMTPFVDVMLVLLVIFMVAAPLMTTSLPVKLPQSKRATSVTPPKKPITLVLQKDGRLFVQDKPVSFTDFDANPNRFLGSDTQATLYVHGDRALNYGTMMTLLDILARHGRTRLALVSEGGKITPKKA